jgi:uncharacterized protein
MKLELSRIRRAEEHFERTFSPEELPQEGEAYRVTAPVQLVMDIRKDKDKFRLVGTVRTELQLACSRCLEPYRLSLDASFDQRYLPQGQQDAEGEVEVEDDDLETSYYTDDQIDLDELLREQFYLALPMKPLCQDACKGLCVQCGTNLNTGTCDCETPWEDPRLATLKNLRTE